MKLKTIISPDSQEEIVIHCKERNDKIKRIEGVIENLINENAEMVLTLANNDKASLLLDGKRQKVLCDKDVVKINQSPYSVKFLRKKNFNFYGRLLSKLNRKGY